MKRFLVYIIGLVFSISSSYAQYSDTVQTFRIRKVSFQGLEQLSAKHLSLITGFQEGELLEIPGSAIGEAVKKIWATGLINDIHADYEVINNNQVDLTFHITEIPILSNIIFKGTSPIEANALIKIGAKYINKKHTTAQSIHLLKSVKEYLQERGYYYVKIDTSIGKDSLYPVRQVLTIHCDNREVVKVKDIYISTSDTTDILPPNKDEYVLTKRNIFTPNKLEATKTSIIQRYKNAGYRDMIIDSVTQQSHDKNLLSLGIYITPGTKYYVGKISISEDEKYTEEQLLVHLPIEKGDVFSEANIQQSIYQNVHGNDFSSLFLDDGYMFLHLEVMETSLRNDTVDVHIKVNKGKRTTIRNITFTGNEKTRDQILMRYVNTKPGDFFSRKNLRYSEISLGSLPYIDMAFVSSKPIVINDSTVDIEYTVKETTVNDQIYASGGWGGSIGLVGTIGLTLNNFSLRDVKELKKWNPLPTGEGQVLSIRAQTNTADYSSFSASFTEPWLGRKKPNSFTLSGYISQYNPNSLMDDGFYKLSNFSARYTKLVPKINSSITAFGNYTKYNLRNTDSVLCSTCTATKIELGLGFTRKKIGVSGSANYPIKGSLLSASFSMTPPYSVLDSDIEEQLAPEKYRLIEYYKWSFDYFKFINLTRSITRRRKAVLVLGARSGFIGAYNNNLGVGPFDRYIMGGDALSSFSPVLGSNFIRLRGYNNESIVPVPEGGTYFEKFIAELKYPVLMRPKWSLYALAFAEAGNTWESLQKTDPFDLYSSAGVGLRFDHRDFQMIGVDYGKGFRSIPNCPECNDWQFHVTFGFGLR